MVDSMVAPHRLAGISEFLPRLSVMAVFVAALFLLVPAGSLLAQTKKSVNDGIYNETQASRGQRLYMGVGRCYACHQRDMAGNEQRKSKPLVGNEFVSDFSDGTLDDLFYKIKFTMPQDDRGPGTLPVEQVSDLIAFILQRNGYPAGSGEIGTDRNVLKMIKFEPPKAAASATTPVHPSTMGRGSMAGDGSSSSSPY